MTSVTMLSLHAPAQEALLQALSAIPAPPCQVREQPGRAASILAFQLTSVHLQQNSSLLRMTPGVLEAHVLSSCSLTDLAALSCTCSDLRQQITPDIWQAFAQRDLPPTHPIRLSRNVRAAAARHGHLAAALRGPTHVHTTWSVSYPTGTTREVLSPDFSLVASAQPHTIAVLERTTARAVASLDLPVGSYAQADCYAVSCDSSILGALVSETHGTCLHTKVVLLVLATQAQIIVDVGTAPLSISELGEVTMSLTWAPSALVLCVMAATDSQPMLRILAASGDVLAQDFCSLPAPSFSWAPSSSFLMCFRGAALTCLNLSTGTQRQHQQQQQEQTLTWVSRPAHAPDLLLARQGQTVQLLAVPSLTVLHTKTLTFTPPRSCRCVGAVVVFEGLDGTLWRAHLNCQPSAGQQFLGSVSSAAQGTWPALSPGGEWLVHCLPDEHNRSRLEIIRLCGPQTGVGVWYGFPGCGVYGRYRPLWSADGCCIAVEGAGGVRAAFLNLLKD